MLNTKCGEKQGWQVFSGAPQMISAGGILTANQQVASTGTETAVATETVYGNTLDTAGQSFRVTLVGEISSEGTGDCTFTLRYGTTDILAISTAALANEDDKTMILEYWGRVHTTGSTGKVVAAARLQVAQGTPLYFWADTANTGTTVDLTADGSLNVTADWDVSSADCDVIITTALIEFFD